MAKKNEIVEGRIEEVIFPNKGVLYIEDGIPVQVADTFTGQKLSVRLIKKKKGIWEGRVIEVLENPEFFEMPACEYFGLCGGCSLQNVPYAKQLAHKHSQVMTLLEDKGVTDFEDVGILPSPNAFKYRNKMEFSFGDACKNGPMALGMHRKRSTYDIITVDGCQIVDEDFSMILRYVLRYVMVNNLPFYHKVSHIGYMRYLVVRRSETTGDLLINLVTTTQMTFDFSALAKELNALGTKGKIRGVLHTQSDVLADAVKPEKVTTVWGQPDLEETLLGLKFHLSPFSFFQTNTKGAEVLYRAALDMFDSLQNKVVFDLYSGTGTIAQIMATEAKEVYGIEIVAEAVQKAIENAAENGLANCHFICGDVLKQVETLTVSPDCIVVDPPREGIHPQAIAKIADFNAKEIVYISCKPTSLVRDLPIFQTYGYQIKKIQCVDMFPQTHHVESIVLLTKVR
jgi:23S rRNA (uracil-5-)-methyltransferase RumA